MARPNTKEYLISVKAHKSSLDKLRNDLEKALGGAMDRIDMGDGIQELTRSEKAAIKSMMGELFDLMGDGSKLLRNMTNGAFDADNKSINEMKKNLKETMEFASGFMQKMRQAGDVTDWMQQGVGFVDQFTKAQEEITKASQAIGGLERALAKLNKNFSGFKDALAVTDAEAYLKRFGNATKVEAEQVAKAQKAVRTAMNSTVKDLKAAASKYNSTEYAQDFAFTGLSDEKIKKHYSDAIATIIEGNAKIEELKGKYKKNYHALHKDVDYQDTIDEMSYALKILDNLPDVSGNGVGANLKMSLDDAVDSVKAAGAEIKKLVNDLQGEGIKLTIELPEPTAAEFAGKVEAFIAKVNGMFQASPIEVAVDLTAPFKDTKTGKATAAQAAKASEVLGAFKKNFESTYGDAAGAASEDLEKSLDNRDTVKSLTKLLTAFNEIYNVMHSGQSMLLDETRRWQEEMNKALTLTEWEKQTKKALKLEIKFNKAATETELDNFIDELQGYANTSDGITIGVNTDAIVNTIQEALTKAEFKIGNVTADSVTAGTLHSGAITSGGVPVTRRMAQQNGAPIKPPSSGDNDKDNTPPPQERKPADDVKEKKEAERAVEDTEARKALLKAANAAKASLDRQGKILEEAKTAAAETGAQWQQNKAKHEINKAAIDTLESDPKTKAEREEKKGIEKAIASLTEKRDKYYPEQASRKESAFIRMSASDEAKALYIELDKLNELDAINTNTKDDIDKRRRELQEKLKDLEVSDEEKAVMSELAELYKQKPKGKKATEEHEAKRAELVRKLQEVQYANASNEKRAILDELNDLALREQQNTQEKTNIATRRREVSAALQAEQKNKDKTFSQETMEAVDEASERAKEYLIKRIDSYQEEYTRTGFDASGFTSVEQIEKRIARLNEENKEIKEGRSSKLEEGYESYRISHGLEKMNSSDQEKARNWMIEQNNAEVQALRVKRKIDALMGLLDTSALDKLDPNSKEYSTKKSQIVEKIVLQAIKEQLYVNQAKIKSELDAARAKLEGVDSTNSNTIDSLKADNRGLNTEGEAEEAEKARKREQKRYDIIEDRKKAIERVRKSGDNPATLLLQPITEFVETTVNGIKNAQKKIDDATKALAKLDPNSEDYEKKKAKYEKDLANGQKSFERNQGYLKSMDRYGFITGFKENWDKIVDAQFKIKKLNPDDANYGANKSQYEAIISNAYKAIVDQVKPATVDALVQVLKRNSTLADTIGGNNAGLGDSEKIKDLAYYIPIAQEALGFKVQSNDDYNYEENLRKQFENIVRTNALMEKIEAVIKSSTQNKDMKVEDLQAFIKFFEGVGFMANAVQRAKQYLVELEKIPEGYREDAAKTSYEKQAKVIWSGIDKDAQQEFVKAMQKSEGYAEFASKEQMGTPKAFATVMRAYSDGVFESVKGIQSLQPLFELIRRADLRKQTTSATRGITGYETKRSEKGKTEGRTAYGLYKDAKQIPQPISIKIITDKGYTTYSLYGDGQAPLNADESYKFTDKGVTKFANRSKLRPQIDELEKALFDPDILLEDSLSYQFDELKNFISQLRLVKQELSESGRYIGSLLDGTELGDQLEAQRLLRNQASLLEQARQGNEKFRYSDSLLGKIDGLKDEQALNDDIANLNDLIDRTSNKQLVRGLKAERDQKYAERDALRQKNNEQIDKLLASVTERATAANTANIASIEALIVAKQAEAKATQDQLAAASKAAASKRANINTLLESIFADGKVQIADGKNAFTPMKDRNLEFGTTVIGGNLNARRRVQNEIAALKADRYTKAVQDQLDKLPEDQRAAKVKEFIANKEAELERLKNVQFETEQVIEAILALEKDIATREAKAAASSKSANQKTKTEKKIREDGEDSGKYEARMKAEKGKLQKNMPRLFSQIDIAEQYGLMDVSWLRELEKQYKEADRVATESLTNNSTQEEIDAAFKQKRELEKILLDTFFDVDGWFAVTKATEAIETLQSEANRYKNGSVENNTFNNTEVKDAKDRIEEERKNNIAQAEKVAAAMREEYINSILNSTEANTAEDVVKQFNKKMAEKGVQASSVADIESYIESVKAAAVKEANEKAKEAVRNVIDQKLESEIKKKIGEIKSKTDADLMADTYHVTDKHKEEVDQTAAIQANKEIKASLMAQYGITDDMLRAAESVAAAADAVEQNAERIPGQQQTGGGQYNAGASGGGDYDGGGYLGAIDTTNLATESTLRAIFSVLNGGDPAGGWDDHRYQPARENDDGEIDTHINTGTFAKSMLELMNNSSKLSNEIMTFIGNGDILSWVTTGSVDHVSGTDTRRGIQQERRPIDFAVHNHPNGVYFPSIEDLKASLSRAYVTSGKQVKGSGSYSQNGMTLIDYSGVPEEIARRVINNSIDEWKKEIPKTYGIKYDGRTRKLHATDTRYNDKSEEELGNIGLNVYKDLYSRIQSGFENAGYNGVFKSFTYDEIAKLVSPTGNTAEMQQAAQQVANAVTEAGTEAAVGATKKTRGLSKQERAEIDEWFVRTQVDAESQAQLWFDTRKKFTGTDDNLSGIDKKKALETRQAELQQALIDFDQHGVFKYDGYDGNLWFESNRGADNTNFKSWLLEKSFKTQSIGKKAVYSEYLSALDHHFTSAFETKMREYLEAEMQSVTSALSALDASVDSAPVEQAVQQVADGVVEAGSQAPVEPTPTKTAEQVVQETVPADPVDVPVEPVVVNVGKIDTDTTKYLAKHIGEIRGKQDGGFALESGMYSLARLGVSSDDYKFDTSHGEQLAKAWNQLENGMKGTIVENLDEHTKAYIKLLQERLNEIAKQNNLDYNAINAAASKRKDNAKNIDGTLLTQESVDAAKAHMSTLKKETGANRAKGGLTDVYSVLSNGKTKLSQGDLKKLGTGYFKLVETINHKIFEKFNEDTQQLLKQARDKALEILNQNDVQVVGSDVLSDKIITDESASLVSGKDQVGKKFTSMTAPALIQTTTAEDGTKQAKIIQKAQGTLSVVKETSKEKQSQIAANNILQQQEQKLADAAQDRAQAETKVSDAKNDGGDKPSSGGAGTKPPSDSGITPSSGGGTPPSGGKNANYPAIFGTLAKEQTLSAIAASVSQLVQSKSGKKSGGGGGGKRSKQPETAQATISAEQARARLEAEVAAKYPHFKTMGNTRETNKSYAVDIINPRHVAEIEAARASLEAMTNAGKKGSEEWVAQETKLVQLLEEQAMVSEKITLTLDKQTGEITTKTGFNNIAAGTKAATNELERFMAMQDMLADAQAAKYGTNGILTSDNRKVDDYLKAAQELNNFKAGIKSEELFSPSTQAELYNMSQYVVKLRKEVEGLLRIAGSGDWKLFGDEKSILDTAGMDGSDIKKKMIEMMTANDSLKASFGDIEPVTDSLGNTYWRLSYTIEKGKNEVQEMTARINPLTGALETQAGAVKHVATGWEKFVSGLKGKFQSIIQYLVSITSIHDVIYRFREGIQYVRDIDLALTELKKVTDETDATYANFLQNMSKTGGVIGATVADLTTMAAEWARIGYTIEESSKLAESTAILMNVSEFDDATEASEALISTMQAFGYTADESQHVVDVLNEVGKFVARR